MFASVPLVLDLLLDTLSVKLLVIALFVFVGMTYWRGGRNSFVGLLVAPFMVVVPVADGLAHLQGHFCGETGIQACSVKAISDTYLCMVCCCSPS